MARLLCVAHATQVRAGLLKGLEQAGDTRLPDVALSRTLKGALMHIQQRVEMSLATAPTAPATHPSTDTHHPGYGALTPPATTAPSISSPSLPWGVTYVVGQWPSQAHGMLLDPPNVHGTSQSSQSHRSGRQLQLRLVAHPGQYAAPLQRALRQHVKGWSQGQVPHQGVAVAVGPEGGWQLGELDLLLTDWRYTQVQLGPRVLTTTNAVITLLGCVAQACWLHCEA